MLIAGMIIVALGTMGIFTSVGMEIALKEPIYLVLMKIFPWFIGLGMLFIGLSVKRRG